MEEFSKWLRDGSFEHKRLHNGALYVATMIRFLRELGINEPSYSRFCSCYDSVSAHRRIVWWSRLTNGEWPQKYWCLHYSLVMYRHLTRRYILDYDTLLMDPHESYFHFLTRVFEHINLPIFQRHIARQNTKKYLWDSLPPDCIDLICTYF
jgi:hypothetical protein